MSERHYLELSEGDAGSHKFYEVIIDGAQLSIDGAMGALARSLPAYRLDVGPEPDAVVAALRGILERHA